MGKEKLCDGQLFNPWHRFDVAKEIRASRALTMGAKVTWEALMDRTRATQNYCFPSYRKIGEDIGASTRNAKRYVRQLVKSGLIRTQHSYADEGRQRSNRFQFIYREFLAARVTDSSPGGTKSVTGG
jgi:DNA-binding MarR family transcriptional regulator